MLPITHFSPGGDKAEEEPRFALDCSCLFLTRYPKSLRIIGWFKATVAEVLRVPR